MGLKQFTNSDGGRITIIVVGLTLLSVVISGGYYAYLTYAPENSTQALQNELKKDANGWPIERLTVGAEKDPLDQLPSTTLSYAAGNTNGSDNKPTLTQEPVGFPLLSLYQDELPSLLNTDITHKDDDTESSYRFRFYSDSLDDYRQGGAYEDAGNRFLAVQEVSSNNLQYTSKPTSSAGREVTISVNTGFKADESNSDETSKLWKDLVNAAASDEQLSQGGSTIVTLTDGDRFTITAQIANEFDRKRALDLNENLWNTFAVYSYGDTLGFLKAEKVIYTVERTDQDSTLKVTVPDDVAKAGGMTDKITEAARRADKLTVLWSYNTYLLDKTGKPVGFLESTSRNW